MLTDKRCPKCGGNVYLNEDLEGNKQLECLQCGWNDSRDKAASQAPKGKGWSEPGKRKVS